MAITFETLTQGWNQIRSSGGGNLKAAVSGLVDPQRILIRRVAETPQTLTVQFSGIDQALENPQRDRAIMNRALFAWVRKFAVAQIMRSGDSDTFTVLIRKSSSQAEPQPTVSENSRQGELARISNVRKLDGDT